MEYIFFAGANGSGKSTLIKNLRSLDEYQGFRYICADELEESFKNTQNKELRMNKAREMAMLLREKSLEGGRNIIFESVASHPAHLEDLDRIKGMGYKITTVYVTTESPEINLARIANRGRDNDTYLTPERVRGRYERSLGLLSEFIKRSDVVLAYDNSINYFAVFYKTPEGKNYLIGEKGWANRYIVEKLQKEGIEVYTSKDIDRETYVKLLNNANRLIDPTRQAQQAEPVRQVGQARQAEQAEKKNTKEKLTAEDEAVVERIRRSKRGGEFEALWRGDSVTGDRSRDEFKMFNMLSWFCDQNREQMQRIYKHSGLYRPELGQEYLDRCTDKILKIYERPAPSSGAFRSNSRGNGGYKGK